MLAKSAVNEKLPFKQDGAGSDHEGKGLAFCPNMHNTIAARELLLHFLPPWSLRRCVHRHGS
jgi:hypothetical protein